MKRALTVCVLSFILAMAGYVANVPTAFAKDAWVSTDSDGVETYVVEESIRSGSNALSRFFTVTIKEVRNGKLNDMTSVSYEKIGSDPWYVHYERGYGGSLAEYKDEVFEHCMKRLGWSYKLSNIGRSSNIYVYR